MKVSLSRAKAGIKKQKMEPFRISLRLGSRSLIDRNGKKVLLKLFSGFEENAKRNKKTKERNEK